MNKIFFYLGVIVISIVGLAFLPKLYGLYQTHTPEQNSMSAEITVSGEKIKTVPLSESSIFQVQGTKGALLIEASPDGVKVIEAECPNKDCVNTGLITSSRQSIVCLHNEMIIKLTGVSSEYEDEKGEELDVIAR